MYEISKTSFRNQEIVIVVAISKKEDTSLESLRFLEILVKCNILVLSVFLHITRL